MAPETAGDPMSSQRWTRRSLRPLRDTLQCIGKTVCPATVGRLLRKNAYCLRANVKREAGADHPDRNTQFEYLAAQKQAFLATGQPVISVDTKKKELIGNFKTISSRTRAARGVEKPKRSMSTTFPKTRWGAQFPMASTM